MTARMISMAERSFIQNLKSTKIIATLIAIPREKLNIQAGNRLKTG
jgi:hypothetical protein